MHRIRPSRAPWLFSQYTQTGKCNLMTRNESVRKSGFRLPSLSLSLVALSLAVAQPAFALCDSVTVTSHAELEAAVVDYNTNCADGSTLTATVNGTINVASVLPVNNSTSAKLEILGDGDDILDGMDSSQILSIVDGIVILETMILQNGNGSAAGFGGALEIFGSADVTVNNTTLTGNQAPNAGAISSTGTLTITNSTFNNNASNPSQSSAIQVEGGGETLIINSTFSNNQSGSLGTVSALGAGTILTITNCTLSGNIAGLGVGGNLVSGLSAEVNVNNTILANSTSDGTTPISDCFVQSAAVNFSSNVSNIVENGGQCGTPGTDYIQADPQLDSLGDNGGSIQTMKLLLGSPGIDAGDNALAVDKDSNPLMNDGRGPGFPRIFHGTVDLGAYENMEVPVEIMTFEIVQVEAVQPFRR